MNNILTFITVSSRQYNISKILESIKSQKSEELIIKWNIIFDFEEYLLENSLKSQLISESSWITYKHIPDERNSIGGGNYGKNILINEIQDGWIYQLDDDNILYPNFIQEFLQLLTSHAQVNLFCFWQLNRYEPKTKEDLKVGITDTAMYIFHKNITTNIEYPVQYGGDGIYLESLIKNEKTKLWIEKKYLCYYNYIKSENKMNHLCKIAQKYGTDKYHRHNYCKAYENILYNYVNKQNVFLLEVGVFKGASLRMWAEWLPNAKIYGVDNWSEITEKPTKDIASNITIISSNSKDISVCDALNHQKFDVIIDDGNHHPYSQLITLWNIWPLLKDNGIYIIEDLQEIETYKKHWSFIPGIEFIDMRQDGGTYDSILLIIKKKKKYNV